MKVREVGTESFRRVALNQLTMQELWEKTAAKFGKPGGAAVRSRSRIHIAPTAAANQAVAQIRELPNVVLMDDEDLAALDNEAELEVQWAAA